MYGRSGTFLSNHRHSWGLRVVQYFAGRCRLFANRVPHHHSVVNTYKDAYFLRIIPLFAAYNFPFSPMSLRKIRHTQSSPNAVCVRGRRYSVFTRKPSPPRPAHQAALFLPPYTRVKCGANATFNTPISTIAISFQIGAKAAFQVCVPLFLWTSRTKLQFSYDEKLFSVLLLRKKTYICAHIVNLKT